MLQEAFVWTDGSVIDNDHFWTRTLGHAIVDENSSKDFAAACVDPWGCTAKAELQAVLFAVKICKSHLTITTNRNSILKVWRKIVFAGGVAETLAYADNWRDIHSLAQRDGAVRLRLRWTKAHSCDNQNVLNMSKGQWLTHFSDSHAKEAARRAYPFEFGYVSALWFHSVLRQKWLTQLSTMLSDFTIENGDSNDGLEECEPVVSRRDTLRVAFPQWDWDVLQSIYVWAPDRVTGIPGKWKFDQASWHRTVSFFFQLRWRTGDDQSVSSFELGYLF